MKSLKRDSKFLHTVLSPPAIGPENRELSFVTYFLLHNQFWSFPFPFQRSSICKRSFILSFYHLKENAGYGEYFDIYDKNISFYSLLFLIARIYRFLCMHHNIILFAFLFEIISLFRQCRCNLITAPCVFLLMMMKDMQCLRVNGLDENPIFVKHLLFFISWVVKKCVFKLWEFSCFIFCFLFWTTKQ